MYLSCASNMPGKIPLVQKLPRYLATLRQSVYSEQEISQLIEDYAKAINDPCDAASEIYLQYLVEKGAIRQIVITGERRNMKRYLAKTDISLAEIACSLQSGGYLSHLAAAYIHQLTNCEPTVICVSKEGSKRETDSEDLDQEDIDAAFQKAQRQSSAHVQWENHHFQLLSGSYADGAGIEQRKSFSLTSIERTLIDLTVRPTYGLGAANILEIYEKAIPTLHMDNIFALLEILAYRYPYHQSIGFYLSQAGYSNQKELNRLRKMGMKHAFYLDYEMTDPVYSDEWNIYFPQALIAD